MAPTQMSRDPGSRTRQALILTAVVYVVLRGWGLYSLPLILTNDSIGYVDQAMTLLGWQHAAADPDAKPFRTPGFPLLLAGLFKVFGMQPLAVLLALKVFGGLACLGVAWLGCRLAGPGLGMTAGLLCCFDPGLLLFEHFALTEVPAAALTVLLIAAVVGLKRTPLWAGPFVGLLLGAAILVRPALQIFVPFTAAAWLVRTRREGWQKVVTHLAVLLLSLAAVLAPRLAVNKQKYDRLTVAPGAGAFLWFGVQRAGLIKPDLCPDDDDIRRAYTPYETTPLSDGAFRAYCRATDGMGRREHLLRRWAIRSVLHDKPAYLRWLVRSLQWQLNLYPPEILDETAWFFRHAARDDSAVCYTIDAPYAKPLVADNQPGLLGCLLKRWGDRPAPWFPTLPLFVFALLTVAGAAWNRRWDLALMFGATVAYVLFHAALLSVPSRYTFPMTVAWYAAVAILPALVRGTHNKTHTPCAGRTDHGATCRGDL